VPIDMQVIRASEFVCVDPDQHLDFEASKNALQALAQACRKRGLDRALVDLRKLPMLPKPRFTPTELAALVMTFREAGFSRQQRLAVLYQEDLHGGIRAFALIGRMRGLQVQAFTQFEEALNWLSAGQDTPAESTEGQIQIPIARPQLTDRVVPVFALAETRHCGGRRRRAGRKT
jgi:hypothetical protein